MILNKAAFKKPSSKGIMHAAQFREVTPMPAVAAVLTMICYLYMIEPVTVLSLTIRQLEFAIRQ